MEDEGCKDYKILVVKRRQKQDHSVCQGAQSRFFCLILFSSVFFFGRCVCVCTVGNFVELEGTIPMEGATVGTELSNHHETYLPINLLSLSQ